MSGRESVLPDVPISFGLRAQGHIETVRAMLRAGRSWDEIGREIGWDGNTAREYWRADQDAVSDLADTILDFITVALQSFTTEQLQAAADHRAAVSASSLVPAVVARIRGDAPWLIAER
jgi:hypothetical protein